MENCKKIRDFLLLCFWIFVIGCVFGFFAEMLYGLVYTRTLVIRKGLIYGPFIQVYGAGALAYFILTKYEQRPLYVFLKGMLLGGALEYFFSFFEEIFFGHVSWEYSDMFLNLNGRTSLQYCIIWGLIGVFFLKVVYPLIPMIAKKIEKGNFRIFSYFFVVFMAFDIIISSMATNRQNQREKEIPASSPIDEFLDKAYPDELLNKIYNNKKNVPIEDIEK